MTNKTAMLNYYNKHPPKLTGKYNNFTNLKWIIEYSYNYNGQTDYVLWLISMGMYETLMIIESKNNG